MSIWQFANMAAWALSAVIAFYLLRDFIRTEKDRRDRGGD